MYNFVSLPSRENGCKTLLYFKAVVVLVVGIVSGTKILQGVVSSGDPTQYFNCFLQEKCF